MENPYEAPQTASGGSGVARVPWWVVDGVLAGFLLLLGMGFSAAMLLSGQPDPVRLVVATAAVFALAFLMGFGAYRRYRTDNA